MEPSQPANAPEPAAKREDERPEKAVSRRWIGVAVAGGLLLLAVAVVASLNVSGPDELRGGMVYEDVTAEPQTVDGMFGECPIHFIEVGGHTWVTKGLPPGSRMEGRLILVDEVSARFETRGFMAMFQDAFAFSDICGY